MRARAGSPLLSPRLNQEAGEEFRRRATPIPRNWAGNIPNNRGMQRPQVSPVRSRGQGAQAAAAAANTAVLQERTRQDMERRQAEHEETMALLKYKSDAAYWERKEAASKARKAEYEEDSAHWERKRKCLLYLKEKAELERAGINTSEADNLTRLGDTDVPDTSRART